MNSFMSVLCDMNLEINHIEYFDILFFHYIFQQMELANEIQ